MERGKQRVSGHLIIWIFSCFAVLNDILEEYLRVITHLSVSINTTVLYLSENRIILVALFVVIRNQKLPSLILILHSKPRVYAMELPPHINNTTKNYQLLSFKIFIHSSAM